MRVREIGASAVVALTLASPLSACTKNNPGTNVNIAGDEEPGKGEGARVEDESETTAVERGPIEKTQISASITGVGDMLDAGSKLIGMWTPAEPGAPALNLRVDVADGLVEMGFGSAFFESLMLDSVHAMTSGIPHEGQPGVTDADVSMTAAISTNNALRALENLPASLRPQPVGDNLWKFVAEGVSLFFRPQSDSLEIAGMQAEGLDLANALRAQVVTGPDEPRLKVRVSNLPPGNIDITELIPLPSQLAGPLSEISNELDAAELAVDFGTDRALMGRVSADAPFGVLGLDPIGAPVTTESELAQALPGDAIGVWMMPWGDPKMLHNLIDKNVPVDQIPAPFDKYVGDVLAGTHELLDLIEKEVLATAYVDKGKVALVFAASVSDEAKARDAMRTILGKLNQALEERAAFYEKSPDFKYEVSFKRDNIKVGKAKGDLFKLTASKDQRDELEELTWFTDAKKPRLEISTVVADGKLIVAIGIGQKAIMSKVARTLGKGKAGSGLEAGGGLALARQLTGGCQYCMTLSPVELGEFLLTHLAASPGEVKEVQVAASKAVKKLLTLGLDGELAFGLRLEQAKGMLGAAVPKELLFADPTKVKTVVELIESLDEAEQAAWAAQSGTKPNDRKTDAPR